MREEEPEGVTLMLVGSKRGQVRRIRQAGQGRLVGWLLTVLRVGPQTKDGHVGSMGEVLMVFLLH